MGEKTVGTEDNQQRHGSQVEGGQTPQHGPSEAHGRKDSDESQLDPSSPGETGTTPGSNGK